MSSNNQNEASAPFVQSSQPNTAESAMEQKPTTQSIAESVQSTTEQIRQQIPSTESVAQQLPSAQDAAETVKQGVSSIASGLGNLINLATTTSAPKVDTDGQHKDPEDLHVPGGFDNEMQNGGATNLATGNGPTTEFHSLPTSEQDANLAGTAAARPGASLAESGFSQDAPVGVASESSTNASDMVGKSNQNIGDQVSDGANYVKQSIGSGAQYVSEQLPSQTQVQESAQNAYSQVPSTQTVMESTQNAGQAVYEQLPSAQTVKENAQAGAQYAVDSAQSGAQYTKEAAQNVAQYTPGLAQNGSQSGSEQQSTAPSLPEDNRTRTMQVVADEVMTGQSSPLTDAGSSRPVIGESVAPEKVVASHRAAHSDLEAASSAEAVHEKSEVERELLKNVAPAPADSESLVSGGQVNHQSVPASGAGTTVVGNWGAEGSSAGVPIGDEASAAGTSQHGGVPSGGVHNGVIGHGSGELEPSILPSVAQRTQAGKDHVERVTIGEPDLTAGVRNGVVGAGSIDEP